MAKINLEKKKKKALIGVEEPKDRVKLKQKMKKAKIFKKPEATGSDDENPEELPIQKFDQQPKISKKNKKKQEKKNVTKEPGSLLKIKPDDAETELLAKQMKMTKKLKKLGKQLKVKAKKNEPEVEADAPSILATTEAIRAAVIAIRKSTEEEAKEKKKLFDKDFRYALQLCYMKIPKVPTKQIRMPLPHSFYDETDDICLIVRDNVRGKKQEYEQTTAAYEKLFREQKIDFIKKVMPLQELKQNYANYEMKRKLEQTYDLFLADGIISGMAFHILGKNFINKRKSPIPVKIKGVDEAKLKAELQLAASKTIYKRATVGPTTSIAIATHKHTIEQFVENIEAILEQLKTTWPGGWVNIKNIYIRPLQDSAVSLPLYISDISPNMVKTPVIVGPKQNRVMKMAKKLEHESKFTLNKDFQIQKKNKGKKRPIEENGEKKEEGAKKMKKEKTKASKEDASKDVDETSNGVKVEELKEEVIVEKTEKQKPKKKKNKNKNKKDVEKTESQNEVVETEKMTNKNKFGKKNQMKFKKQKAKA